MRITLVTPNCPSWTLLGPYNLLSKYILALYCNCVLMINRPSEKPCQKHNVCYLYFNTFFTFHLSTVLDGGFYANLNLLGSDLDRGDIYTYLCSHLKTGLSQSSLLDLCPLSFSSAVIILKFSNIDYYQDFSK